MAATDIFRSNNTRRDRRRSNLRSFGATRFTLSKEEPNVESADSFQYYHEYELPAPVSTPRYARKYYCARGIEGFPAVWVYTSSGLGHWHLMARPAKGIYIQFVRDGHGHDFDATTGDNQSSENVPPAEKSLRITGNSHECQTLIMAEQMAASFLTYRNVKTPHFSI